MNQHNFAFTSKRSRVLNSQITNKRESSGCIFVVLENLLIRCSFVREIILLSAHNLPAALAFIYSSINRFQLEKSISIVEKIIKS